jgi:hypothetical protein
VNKPGFFLSLLKKSIKLKQEEREKNEKIGKE